jgi:hypothetical protein
MASNHKIAVWISLTRLLLDFGLARIAGIHITRRDPHEQNALALAESGIVLCHGRVDARFADRIRRREGDAKVVDEVAVGHAAGDGDDLFRRAGENEWEKGVDCLDDADDVDFE